jgi:hypothetical protein
MLANGTILVGVGGNGPAARAQAVLEIHPGDTNYQMIIDHVGGLKTGETKPIPPWPDQPAARQDPPPAKENAPRPRRPTADEEALTVRGRAGSCGSSFRGRSGSSLSRVP